MTKFFECWLNDFESKVIEFGGSSKFYSNIYYKIIVKLVLAITYLERNFRKKCNWFGFIKILPQPAICLSLGVHVVDQINNSVAVSVLVVVPGHQFDKCTGQLDSSLGVKDGGTVVSKEVSRNNHILSVSKDS